MTSTADDPCPTCGATRGIDGWQWHLPFCSAGRLPKDAQERIRDQVEEVRRARLEALVESRNYVVG